MTATLIAAPKAFAFKGKGKELRSAALAGVASLAYNEGASRAETITQLRLALGNKPTADEVDACKLQYVVGRVAHRIGSDPQCKGKTVAELLAFALQLVTQYAAPEKDGVAARKLRKGQIGRRTVAQHRAIRASEEAWSQVKAEAVPAVSTAKTQAQRNADKRKPAPQMAGSRKGKADATPTHSALTAATTAPKSQADAVEHVGNMLASLLAYCNKNAGKVPTNVGSFVKRAKAEGDKEIALWRSTNS
jgi:hypothetical protein